MRCQPVASDYCSERHAPGALWMPLLRCGNNPVLIFLVFSWSVVTCSTTSVATTPSPSAGLDPGSPSASCSAPSVW